MPSLSVCLPRNVAAWPKRMPSRARSPHEAQRKPMQALEGGKKENTDTIRKRADH